MSYHATNSYAGMGADPGCADVPYPSPSGSMAMGQICTSGTSCGMVPGSLRAVLETLGYHCPSGDCRESLRNFRNDRGLPRDAADRGDIIITDCQPLYTAYTALMSKQQTPPAPTPLPSTGTRKLLSVSSSRVLSSVSKPASLRPAGTSQASSPTTTAEPVVGFWEARSTVEKGLIIAGGVAVVGAIAFAFTR